MSQRRKKRSSPTLREELYRKHRGKCALCGGKLDKNDFTLDHIKPLSRGGYDKKENLQPAHRSCNLEKRDMTMYEYSMYVLSRQESR
jgi:5-methylcytosine-specific restriction endonuclease McrA